MHALRFTRHSRLVATTRASPDCADDSGFFVDEQAARKMARDRRATRRPRRFNDILHPHENTVHFYNRQVSRTGTSRAGEIVKNGARNRQRTSAPVKAFGKIWGLFGDFPSAPLVSGWPMLSVYRTTHSGHDRTQFEARPERVFCACAPLPDHGQYTHGKTRQHACAAPSGSATKTARRGWPQGYACSTRRPERPPASRDGAHRRKRQRSYLAAYARQLERLGLFSS